MVEKKGLKDKEITEVVTLITKLGKLMILSNDEQKHKIILLISLILSTEDFKKLLKLLKGGDSDK